MRKEEQKPSSLHTAIEVAKRAVGAQAYQKQSEKGNKKIISPGAIGAAAEQFMLPTIQGATHLPNLSEQDKEKLIIKSVIMDLLILSWIAATTVGIRTEHPTTPYLIVPCLIAVKVITNALPGWIIEEKSKKLN